MNHCMQIIFQLCFSHKQETGVSTVGMGSGLKHDVLQLMASRGNPVVQVKDFSKLQGMLDRLSACSGSLTRKVIISPLSNFFLFCLFVCLFLFFFFLFVFWLDALREFIVQS